MKVTLKKQIHSGFSAASSNDVYLEKEIDLSFAPFIGLCITVGWNCETITDVSYDIDKQTFNAYTSPDEQLYNARTPITKHNTVKLKQIVDEYLTNGFGWSVKVSKGK